MSVLRLNLVRKKPRLRSDRSRAHDQEVLDQVREHGGFSVFWVTEKQCRAKAAERLEKNGIIKRVAKGQYPWCPYRVEK